MVIKKLFELFIWLKPGNFKPGIAPPLKAGQYNSKCKGLYLDIIDKCWRFFGMFTANVSIISQRILQRKMEQINQSRAA